MRILSFGLVLGLMLGFPQDATLAEGDRLFGTFRMDLHPSRPKVETPYVQSAGMLHDGMLGLVGPLNLDEAHADFVDLAKARMTSFLVSTRSTNLAGTTSDDGHVVLAAVQPRPGLGVGDLFDEDAFVASLGETGAVSWGWTIRQHLRPVAVLQGGDGFVVAGWEPRRDLVPGTYAYRRNAIVMEIRSDGTVPFARIFPDTSVAALAKAPSEGTYVLLGETILRMTTEGAVLWARKLNVPETIAFTLSALAATPEGVMAVGRVLATGPSGNDILVMRLLEDGSLASAWAIDVGPIDNVEHVALVEGAAILSGSAQVMGRSLDDPIPGAQGLLVRAGLVDGSFQACVVGPGRNDFIDGVVPVPGGLIGAGIFHPQDDDAALDSVLVGLPSGLEDDGTCRSVKATVKPVPVRLDASIPAIEDRVVPTASYQPEVRVVTRAELSPFDLRNR